ncbi:hypothetical protein [Saccharicrinis fermentans]|uniref:Fibronectin type III domain protein n=1 Tax=Saccharicrinis fermentans DSM 9555 = JCM 21142 TaxID=869213 RepID=W7YT35_9BACT|nr:hypothetical protein [Saccharicrinis fermentans]GAF05604.1 hypothetical protein JCM21142_104345 [Saccharicrinis fermentans DSM 9555 = JCM 21142]
MKHYRNKKFKFIFLAWLCIFGLVLVTNAQITLLGDNAPHANVNDGDFEAVRGYWRQSKQSPCWTTKNVEGLGEYGMGLHNGTMFSNNDLGIAESILLNTNPDYQNPKVGDVMKWSFGADLEYISNGTISLSLVFGRHERIVADRVELIGSDKVVEHFSGTYTLNEEDVKGGLPFVRATFYSEDEIKVFLHYVNLSVVDENMAGPEITAEVQNEGIQLSWNDKMADENSQFYVYRQSGEKEAYIKLVETFGKTFLDTTLMNGVEYTYVVTRFNQEESGASNKVNIVKKDKVAPAAPTNLIAEEYESEIKVSWTESTDRDVQSYSVFRGDAKGNNLQEIAHNITNNSYLDFTPTKDIYNTYVVFAKDYSGNLSLPSENMKAKVKMVSGASFSDLILPMPIHKKLTSNTWGAEGVVPRDVDNGIEDSEWSYWGGRPVYDKDGKYHMCVTRWPANATKGHWEWPRSTIAHAVADEPDGPYKVKDDIAYNFEDGLGHNPDVILLNDGTYMLYSLINWEATLFTSNSMSGPWKRLGIIKVDENTKLEDPNLFYRFYRNLSGVHMHDGRFLFVTKGGAMMMSEGKDPLGPYKVMTSPLQGNSVIPEKYRNSNFEDPVLWKDEVQYHMIINAFWDYRAIYLRSPDGIHWKFNPGTAYTPNNTSYEDGTQTRWCKLERPHVLTDEYGRATHLSLAVIDVLKADDLARDNHSSKNIILPLVLHKRIQMLNKEMVSSNTKKIKIRILSEDGFDAQKDVDIASLCFGASEEVDFGRGCKAVRTKKKGKDLIVEFDGVGNGISDDNFACKLLGKTKKGELIIGFSKLVAE